MLSLSLLASLFAETRDDPLTRPEILWGTLGLTLSLLVGAGVIYAVDKWRKRAAEGTRDDTESLTSFRAMYEAGEITEAEYAELKRKLAERVKKGGVPPPEPPAGPAAPPPAPPPA
jgi:hypothetical protein